MHLEGKELSPDFYPPMSGLPLHVCMCACVRNSSFDPASWIRTLSLSLSSELSMGLLACLHTNKRWQGVAWDVGRAMSQSEPWSPYGFSSALGTGHGEANRQAGHSKTQDKSGLAGRLARGHF